MLINLSIILSVIFILLQHPMSMGLILLMQTMIIAMIMGMLNSSFLMSYILIISIFSGMLVLFMYMSSVASNEKFKSSPLYVFFTSMFLMIDSKVIMNPNLNDSVTSNELNEGIYQLFNENFLIMLFLTSYLFINMIVISHIVNIWEGPLRMKN